MKKKNKHFKINYILQIINLVDILKICVFLLLSSIRFMLSSSSFSTAN